MVCNALQIIMGNNADKHPPGWECPGKSLTDYLNWSIINKNETMVDLKENRFKLNGNIYSKASDGHFYSPFSLSIDNMEHLILINFEKNPDKYYNTFELQQAS